MTRWQRVAVSFASAMAADVLVAAVQAAPHPIGRPGASLVAALYFLLLVLPVWLFSLPILLWFNRLDGWRLWALAAIGLLLGPVCLSLLGFTLQLYYHIQRSSFWPPFRYDILGVALAISALSTIFYLGTLTFFDRRSPSSRTQ